MLIKLLSIFSLLVILVAFETTTIIASPLSQGDPIYVVQKGDTLNSIALRFGISPDELQSVNGISDPNALYIGQRLTLPGLPGISGILTSGTLSYGESLTNLIRQYNVDQNGLAFLNKMTSPSEAIAGSMFILPINDGQDQLAPVRTIANGETTLEAAIHTDTSPWTIIQNNQLQATWDILPGEVLFGSDNKETSHANMPGVSEISFNILPIIQGETLTIAIASNFPAEFSGDLNGEKLHFFTEDAENYYSFHGIHALAEPGVVPLAITMLLDDATNHTFEQLVLLAPGNYGNDPIFYVDDIYVDPDIIAEEDAIINEVLSKITQSRYWDGVFQYPIDEPCINGFFGSRRNYNDGALYYYHTGVDFGVCAQNLNIYAPAAGEVVFAGEMIIRGNAILIDHGWGVFSGYWHLSEFNVDVGDFVEPGDLLGQIGNTGRSVGPHLHFEMDISGNPVNALTWLTQEFP